MFILRTLVPCHGKENAYSERNSIIGEAYNLSTPEETQELILSDDYWKSVKDNIYLFLVYDGGSKVLPLYKNQKNYMMTDSGNTFANLSES